MSKKKSLNLEHGFVKSIRRRLYQSAAELGMQPAERTSPSTNATSETGHHAAIARLLSGSEVLVL